MPSGEGEGGGGLGAPAMVLVIQYLGIWFGGSPREGSWAKLIISHSVFFLDTGFLSEVHQVIRFPFCGSASGFQGSCTKGSWTKCAVMDRTINLVDDDGTFISFAESELGIFCRHRQPPITKPENLKELLNLGPRASSRKSWEPHVKYGLRLPSAVKYIEPVEGQGDIVPILPWKVGHFIATVAKQRDDMAGLRSEKNVYSFVNGHKIKGSVREEYGSCLACPRGWRLADAPADPGEYLGRALLSWKVRPLPVGQSGSVHASFWQVGVAYVDDLPPIVCAPAWQVPMSAPSAGVGGGMGSFATAQQVRAEISTPVGGTVGRAVGGGHARWWVGGWRRSERSCRPCACSHRRCRWARRLRARWAGWAALGVALR